jgi:hypothetical protein
MGLRPGSSGGVRKWMVETTTSLRSIRSRTGLQSIRSRSGLQSWSYLYIIMPCCSQSCCLQWLRGMCIDFLFFYYITYMSIVLCYCTLRYYWFSRVAYNNWGYCAITLLDFWYVKVTVPRCKMQCSPTILVNYSHGQNEVPNQIREFPSIPLRLAALWLR